MALALLRSGHFREVSEAYRAVCKKLDVFPRFFQLCFEMLHISGFNNFSCDKGFLSNILLLSPVFSWLVHIFVYVM